MPTVDKECVTHHYACECRERVLQDYIKAMEAWESITDDRKKHSAEEQLAAIKIFSNLDKAWKALKKLKHD